MNNYPPGVTDRDFDDNQLIDFDELRRVLSHAHIDIQEGDDEEGSLKLDATHRKMLTDSVFAALEAIYKALKVCQNVQNYYEAEPDYDYSREDPD